MAEAKGRSAQRRKRRLGAALALSALSALPWTQAAFASTTNASMRISTIVPAIPGTCLMLAAAPRTQFRMAADSLFTIAVRCSGTVPYRVALEARLRLAETVTLLRGTGLAPAATGHEAAADAGCRSEHGADSQHMLHAVGAESASFVCDGAAATDFATITY